MRYLVVFDNGEVEQVKSTGVLDVSDFGPQAKTLVRYTETEEFEESYLGKWFLVNEYEGDDK